MTTGDRHMVTFTWFLLVCQLCAPLKAETLAVRVTHPLVWHVHLNLPSEITVSFRIIMPVNYSHLVLISVIS